MKNGTLLDYRLIETHVDNIAKEQGVQSSQAFIALVLQERLNLDNFDIEDSIIDGPNDCGIDAIYIDDQEDRPLVYLFQSKYYQAINKFDRSFEAAALDKMRGAISDLILNIPDSDKYTNQKLSDKLNDIRKLDNPKFIATFISNSNHPQESSKEKFYEYLDRMSGGQDFFETEYLHLAEISKLLAPQKTKKIDADIKLEGTYMTADTGIARTLIGRVSGTELAKLRSNHGLELFDKNVRGYLSRTNQVNKQIIKSATSEDSYKFFYMNNGLTIVCSKYTYTPVNEGPILKVSDMQIVNGGQTTNSIFEAYEKKDLRDDVRVLVRIIETNDEDLLQKITESTNTQTLVNARDLRSNDPIQKKIESHLKQKGYYYESRANKYKGIKGVSSDSRVDAVKAAQAYYAFNDQEPAAAKNKKRLLFGTLYSVIFNDALDVNTFLDAYRMFRIVNQSTKKYKAEYSFASYAEFHTIAVLKKLGTNPEDDHNKTTTKIKKILSATKKVVNQKISEMGEDYSHRALFIDSATLGHIEQVLKERDIL